jgi:2-octaprenyl-6-methoxyphenol hydroxylase
MDYTSDVAIVGAGLNGLTLSIALENSKLKVIIIDSKALQKDRFLKEKFNGRAYALAKASQNLFNAINLWKSLDSSAQPILDIMVTDGRLETGPSGFFMHFNHKKLGDQPLGYTIEDRHLKEVLNNNVNDTKNVKIVSETVTDWKIEDSVSHIYLENGDIIKSKVILACDGQNSKMAKNAGISATHKDYGQHAIVTSVEHEYDHKSTAYQFFMPNGPLAILPLSRNRSSIVWVLPNTLASSVSRLRKEAFTEAFKPVFGDFLGKIKIIGKRFSYPLSSIIADDLIAERLVLVGDSAHSIHPIAGQGFNQGLRDVATIAEVLTDARRRGEDIGASHVLERYANWRRFDSKILSKSTDFFNSLFSNDNSYSRLGRGLGMNIINKTPVLHKFFMREAAGLNGDQPRLLQGKKL